MQVLMDNGKCTNRNETIPLVQVRNVIDYMPQLKYMLNGMVADVPAKRQRNSQGSIIWRPPWTNDEPPNFEVPASMEDSPHLEASPTPDTFHEFRKRYQSVTQLEKLAENYISTVGDAYWDQMSNYLLNATIQYHLDNNWLKQETKVENKYCLNDPRYNCYW